VIARLRGRPVVRRPEGLVLDVNGVGYLVAATTRALRLADEPRQSGQSGQDLRSDGGLGPSEIADRLIAAGADVVGANCGIGPAELYQVVTGMVGSIHNAWWFHNPVTSEKRYVFLGQEGPGVVDQSESHLIRHDLAVE